MSHVIVHTSVEDYGRWKPLFEAHASERRDAGCTGGQVFRDAKNPNDLTIVLQWADMDRARAFGKSDTLREAMARAGVTGIPTMQYVEKMADVII